MEVEHLEALDTEKYMDIREKEDAEAEAAANKADHHEVKHDSHHH